MKRARGQAITEFVLIVPVMIVIIFYSLYFTELVRTKIKLQEASRFAAWEMTSHVLDDYGKAQHALAFRTAQQATIADAQTRFRDLESIDDRSPGGFIVGYQNLTTTIEDLEAEPLNLTIPAFGSNRFVSGLVGVLGANARSGHEALGFNTHGKVRVEVRVQLDNRILPQHFLDENGGGFFKAEVMGGRNLQHLSLHNRFTLLASGWQLPDGADAEQHQAGTGGPRAGVHRGGSDSGLYGQVQRMRLFGAPGKLSSLPGLNQVRGLLGKSVPDPLSATFVVSHNYFEPLNAGIKSRGCDRDPSHPAPMGMNNLENDTGSDGPGLDWNRRKCYDTAPFRDTSAYQDSPYIRVFEARGRYFMGCQAAQADDPSEAGAPAFSNRDRHNKKVRCETR